MSRCNVALVSDSGLVTNTVSIIYHAEVSALNGNLSVMERGIN